MNFHISSEKHQNHKKKHRLRSEKTGNNTVQITIQ